MNRGYKPLTKGVIRRAAHTLGLYARSLKDSNTSPDGDWDLLDGARMKAEYVELTFLSDALYASLRKPRQKTLAMKRQEFGVVRQTITSIRGGTRW